MSSWAWDYETDYYHIYSYLSDEEGAFVLHLPKTPENDDGVDEIVQILDRLYTTKPEPPR
ncbi:MAG: hypothetical protein H8K07_01580 [Nitrospira sp.]|nr:hypothetical protein [Nitrospira sp.]